MENSNHTEKYNSDDKLKPEDLLLVILFTFIVGYSMAIWTFITIFKSLLLTPETLPILDYLTIALTLFGFTLIGGIFEKKPDKSPHIVKSLFRDSLIFLSAGMSFFLAFSLIPFMKTAFDFLFYTAYIVGAISFSIAICSLFYDLISFYLKLKRAKVGE
jgi:hypothetical protein